MANAPEIKSAGFFGGSTELAEYLVKTGKDIAESNLESKQKVIDINGQKYCWTSNYNCWQPVKPINFIPDDAPFPEPIRFFTLDGVIDYIKENVEGLIPDEHEKRLIIHVVDHKTVKLLSHPSEYHKERYIIASCEAHTPDITFGRYMDTETFNTMLLSDFIETEAREQLFRVIKSMTKEQNCNTTDDGVSQVITVKQGVSMASNVTFQNPVPLKPMRTFTEVEQPESNFTLRVNENAEAALYEADGGAWKNEAVRSIKEYLRNNLAGYNVVVFA